MNACDWGKNPDEDGECPYCAGDMCALFDGLGCTHNAEQRHGYDEDEAEA